jgi:hypothetical protein
MPRLFFDEPLSEALCEMLGDIFPGSLHIQLLGQGGAADATVWDLARQHGCLVVSKDEDFDLDLCVVVPDVSRDFRDAVYAIAWEVGFDKGRLLAPIILSEEDFERAPMSASTLVAKIRREGMAA